MGDVSWLFRLRWVVRLTVMDFCCRIICSIFIWCISWHVDGCPALWIVIGLCLAWPCWIVMRLRDYAWLPCLMNDAFLLNDACLGLLQVCIWYRSGLFGLCKILCFILCLVVAALCCSFVSCWCRVCSWLNVGWVYCRLVGCCMLVGLVYWYAHVKSVWIGMNMTLVAWIVLMYMVCNMLGLSLRLVVYVC